MFVHSSKALLFSGFGFDQHMQKELIVFLCTKLQGCGCPSAPIGDRQGPGRWPRGTRDDMTTTKQPRAQSSEEKLKRKQTNPSPEGFRKEMWLLLLQKEIFSYVFILFFLIKTYQNG